MDCLMPDAPVICVCSSRVAAEVEYYPPIPPEGQQDSKLDWSLVRYRGSPIVRSIHARLSGRLEVDWVEPCINNCDLATHRACSQWHPPDGLSTAVVHDRG